MIQSVSGPTSKLHKVYIHPKCKMFTYSVEVRSVGTGWNLSQCLIIPPTLSTSCHSTPVVSLERLLKAHLTTDDATLEQQGVLVFGRDGVEAADWHWPGIDLRCASSRSEPDVQ